ncbi:hypothetical protein [Capnocytophaga felis]|uniref:DUF1963 domain-containing protein n=1 Tax=Capnocytophaga felis TaxID=2267611 RepID=A0A5M4B7C2_9FLAO|nr:hypothetical protein [Capnocytophaga felis]GET45418.1 hypothetical protein RCZ01_07200 [Capnocytophaga felis]GET47419.1 hypothetical protein RCZ02_02500 [Capnocytophaga felis]
MYFRENINDLNENLHPFPKAEAVFSEKQSWLKEHFLPLISINLKEINPEWEETILHMINPIEPYEGYIGEYTKDFHNEFIGVNWLAFRLTKDNKYEFLGKEGYFLRSPMYHNQLKEMMTQDWDMSYFKNNSVLFEQRKQEIYEEALKNFDEAISTYNQNKKDFQKKGYFGKKDELPYYGGNYLDSLGGDIQGGNWVDSEPIPSAFVLTEDEDWNISITHNGNPFYQIASVSGYSYSHGADAIIMLYEPISHIVLFTFDYS